MPLWKIYHPAGAFTAEDKKALSRQVTGIYVRIPIPRFYVVTIFEEIERGLRALWGASPTINSFDLGSITSQEHCLDRSPESGG